MELWNRLLFRKYYLVLPLRSNHERITLTLDRRLSSKNVKVARPTMFNYIFSREEFEYYAHELWRLMTEEKFKTRIHKIYPLTNAAKAHDVSSADGPNECMITKVTGS